MEYNHQGLMSERASATRGKLQQELRFVKTMQNFAPKRKLIEAEQSPRTRRQNSNRFSQSGGEELAYNGRFAAAGPNGGGFVPYGPNGNAVLASPRQMQLIK